jgi:hypothetical protein
MAPSHGNLASLPGTDQPISKRKGVTVTPFTTQIALMNRRDAQNMRSLLEITSYWLNGLAARSLVYITIYLTKISIFLAGGQAKMTVQIIGGVRVHGPRVLVMRVINAIEKLNEEDEEMYSRLIAGKPLLILCGSDTNSLIFEHGVFIFAIKFMASLEVLVSFFAFWCIFQKSASMRNLANKENRMDQIGEAAQACMVWMEARRYPKEFVEWVRIGGLQKNGLPPKVTGKASAKR